MKNEKTYRNTPKGRSKLPSESGSYQLLNKNGEITYTGKTNNLKRRIREHHYDVTKSFSYIKFIQSKNESTKNRG